MTLIDKSTVSNNSSPRFGGGISSSGTLTLKNSTVNGNTTTGNGGGIINYGAATLNNSTVSNNEAGTEAGGIANWGGSLSGRNDTITGNEPTGIVNMFGGTTNLTKSLVQSP